MPDEARAPGRVVRRAPSCRTGRRRSARRRSGDADQCGFSRSLRGARKRTEHNGDCLGLLFSPLTHTAVKCVAGRARARCGEQTKEKEGEDEDDEDEEEDDGSAVQRMKDGRGGVTPRTWPDQQAVDPGASGRRGRRARRRRRVSCPWRRSCAPTSSH